MYTAGPDPDGNNIANHNLNQSKFNIQELLSERKLVLLVDLDDILVSSYFCDSEEEAEEKAVSNNEIVCGTTLMYREKKPHEEYFVTEIKPGTHELLRKMSQLFQLHITTFSNQPYAEKISEIINPEQSIFTNLFSRMQQKIEYLMNYCFGMRNVLLQL